MEMIHISIRDESGLAVGNYTVAASCGYPEVGDFVLLYLDERFYEAKILKRTFSYALTAAPNSLSLILICGSLIEKNA